MIRTQRLALILLLVLSSSTLENFWCRHLWSCRYAHLWSRPLDWVVSTLDMHWAVPVGVLALFTSRDQKRPCILSGKCCNSQGLQYQKIEGIPGRPVRSCLRRKLSLGQSHHEHNMADEQWPGCWRCMERWFWIPFLYPKKIREYEKKQKHHFHENLC